MVDLWEDDMQTKDSICDYAHTLPEDFGHQIQTYEMSEICHETELLSPIP